MTLALLEPRNRSQALQIGHNTRIGECLALTTTLPQGEGI